MSGSSDTRARVVLVGTMLLSLLVHLGASVSLSWLPPPAVALAAVQEERIEIEIAEPEAPEPEAPTQAEEPAVEPETPAPRPDPPRERAPQPERTEPTPPPAAPLAEQVEDFGGTVMMAGSGAGWATQQGSGQDVAGPIGNPVARTTGRNVAGRSDGEVGGTGTAPAAARTVNYSVGARPPPGMGAHLRSFYPPAARARNIEGRARIMFRVSADGTVEVLNVVSESPPGQGFGRACMDGLRAAPRFTPARDENNDPVGYGPRAYNCTFSVN